MKAGNDVTASVKVTPDTYIRAETDRAFHNFSQQAGGVNRWFYIRKPTPLDQQSVVRMNRDTLYSASVVDTSKGPDRDGAAIAGGSLHVGATG